MSKYDVDGNGNGICAWCDKPSIFDADLREWRARWIAAGEYDNDAELNAWANQFCWHGWLGHGKCRAGMSIEERLIEVLEQRDALRAELACLIAQAQERGTHETTD